MKYLWIAWKDWTHPQAGGAEVVLHQLVKRQALDGHEVALLTALHPGAASEEELDGVRIIRLKASRYLQPFVLLPYYIRHLRNKFDVVIETVNTTPYFTPFFRGRARSVLFYHQLAREVWFYEAPFPISFIGYALLEPIATFILSRARAITITVSESTKHDLMRFGFKPERIKIISEGIELQPISSLDAVTKYEAPTLLSHGAMRAMKNTLDQVKAFEIAKQHIPALQMKVSGSAKGPYGKKVLDYIAQSPYKDDIAYLGKTTDTEKVELMQRCHIKLQTAIKEGWGITVTEANSQGTPAVVYDADGLRDSVRNGVTGIVTKCNPRALADAIALLLSEQKKYQAVRYSAWEWSKAITFDQSYRDFVAAMEPAA